MPRHGCASCSDKAAFVRTNVSPPRSCRFFIAPFSHNLDSSPAATDAPHALSSSSQLSRPRHSSPFFLPRSFSPAAPSAVARSFRAALSGRDDAKVNPLPGIILLPARPAHAAFFPWFLMPPHPRKEQAPKYSARRRAPAGFVRLPAFALRPHSASAFRLHPFPFAPGHSFRLQPTCFRPAASPYAKGPPADADGPLHCNKTPIRIQACIPG